MAKEEKLTKKEEKAVDKKLRHLLYERAKRHSNEFQLEFRKHILTAVSAAFGFLIALSWREPISDLVNLIIEKLGVGGTFVYYKFLSAIVVTILAVLVLMIVSKFGIEKKD